MHKEILSQLTKIIAIFFLSSVVYANGPTINFKTDKKLRPTAETISEEFRTEIPKTLGYRFGVNKEDMLTEYQHAMLQQKAVLDERHKVGKISFDEYLAEMSNVLEKSLFQAKKILSDEEFHKLFNISENDIHGIMYNLVNTGLPAEEQITDPRN